MSSNPPPYFQKDYSAPSENARNNKRPSLKSQTSLDDRDNHKILLQDIARALDANSSNIKRLKDFLCFRHPSHLTARDQQSNMSGFDLLQMMERKDLLSRNNYHNLREALEEIGLKKFNHAIEEACVDNREYCGPALRISFNSLFSSTLVSIFSAKR